MRRVLDPKRYTKNGHRRWRGPGSWSHGLAHTPEYSVWQDIKKRCLNPQNRWFKHYGGRGITICLQWQESFEAFYDHIGPRPSAQHTVDRIDNDGHYEPGNVKWSTMAEQNQNKRQPNGYASGVDLRVAPE
jgi:hypothetical protein